MLLDMVPDSLEMNTVYSSLLENYGNILHPELLD